MASNNMFGNSKGIAVYNKLALSTDPKIQGYFGSMYKNLCDGRTVYFSDMIEQRKKKMNNQILYRMQWDKELLVWDIEEWHVPIKMKG